MKIFKINKNIGVINNQTKQNLHSALEKMREKSTYTISGNGCRFSTTYVSGAILKDNNNALFSSPEIFVQSKPLKEFSTVRYNDKCYMINNITGEVQPEKFSLIDKIFGSAKEKLRNISNVINSVSENFENFNKVEYRGFGFEGLTEKGAKKLQNAIDAVQKR